MERKLWQIWADALRVNDFGVHDSFFALGGHSLLATVVLTAVRQLLGVDLPLRAIFEQPTVAGLAELAREAGAATAGPSDELADLIAELERISAPGISDGGGTGS